MISPNCENQVQCDEDYKKALDYVTKSREQQAKEEAARNAKNKRKSKDQDSGDDDDGVGPIVVAIAIGLPLLAILVLVAMAICSNCFKKPICCWKKVLTKENFAKSGTVSNQSSVEMSMDRTGRVHGNRMSLSQA